MIGKTGWLSTVSPPPCARSFPGFPARPQAQFAAGVRVFSWRKESVLLVGHSGWLKSPIPPAATSRRLSAKACVLSGRLEHEDRYQHNWDDGTAKTAPPVLDQPRYAGD